MANDTKQINDNPDYRRWTRDDELTLASIYFSEVHRTYPNSARKPSLSEYDGNSE
jgi:hypothetical protein